MSQVVNRTLNIVIQATGAEAQLDRLKKKEEALNKEIAKTNDVGKRKDYEQQLTVTKDKIESLTGVISGKLTPSLNMSKQAVNKLHKELSDMSKDAPGYADKFKAYELAAKNFDVLNNKVEGVRKTFGDFISETKKVAAGVLIGNTVTAAVSTIGGYFSGALSGAAKLSDELANIRKAANLSEAEVKKLNSELSKIDSRTGNSDLREIAEGLGQVGEAVTADAVAAIDKINVALGDEFGSNAKQITTDLAKLRNNLQDIKTGNFGEDILHIGNALNFLGANGLATAPVIVDFAQRMSGVAGTFGLTSGQILGTAATFEELGISVERGATAFTKSLQRIAADPLKFAKALNYTEEQTKAFVNLVNTDLGAAFNQVAVDARKAGVSNVAFGQILKELDADGSGAGEVLSKLAANQELLSTRVGQATEQLKLSGSITDEFGIKNTNLAAELAKVQKQFVSMIQSPAVTEFLVAAVKGGVAFINVLVQIPKFLYQNIQAIGILTIAYAVYNARKIEARIATILETIATKANTAATVGATAATNLMNAAKLLMIGRVKDAGVAFKAFWTILKANPIGLILTGIGLLIIAYNALRNRTNTALEAQKKLNDANVEGAKNAAVEIKALEDTYKAATNKALGVDKQTEAAKKLQSTYPLTFANFSLEEIKAGKAEDAYKRLAVSILSLSKIKAKQSVIDKNNEDSAGDLQKLLNKKAELDERLKTASKVNKTKTLDNNDVIILESEFEEINQRKEKIEAAITILQNATDRKNKIFAEDIAKDNLLAEQARKEQEARQQREQAKLLKSNSTISGGTTSTPDSLNSKKPDRDKADKQRISDADALFKELLQLKFDLELADQNAYIQEVTRADKKFEELKIRANGNKKNIELAEEIHQKELANIRQKYVDMELAEELKKFEEKLKNDEEFRIRTANAIRAAAEKTAEDIAKNGALNSRDRLAAQELKTQIGTNKQKLQATLDLLDMQEAAEVQGTDKTENEILLIHEKYNKLRAEAQITNTQKTLQLTLEYSKIALDAFSAIDNALKEREEREIKRIDKQKNLEINGFKYQLDQKLISQKQYDIKVAAAEEAAQKKISAIRLKEWKREKAIRLANATLSGVESVLTGLKQGGLPLAVAYGLLAATQVGVIAASKPPEFAKGGFVPQGSSHQQGGLGIYDHATGQHVGTMEGNEPIISKPVYMANKPLVDELLHRGYTSNYSSLNPTWRTAQPAVMNLPKVTNSMQQVGYFAKGGFAPDATSTNNNNQLAEVMNLLVKQLQMPIKSYTVLSEHEAKKEQLQTIVNDATLK